MPGRLCLLPSGPFLGERVFLFCPKGEEGVLPVSDAQMQPLEKDINQQKEIAVFIPRDIF